MASDIVRLTGMNSGLDTEAIIGAYTSTHSKRVDDEKTNLTDAWYSVSEFWYNVGQGKEGYEMIDYEKEFGKPGYAAWSRESHGT